MAAPIDDPLSKSATAHPLSRLGNHSETALVAAGQLRRLARAEQETERKQNERSPARQRA